MLTSDNSEKEILDTEEKHSEYETVEKKESILKNDLTINNNDNVEENIEKNKFIALLSYLSILILIPLFVAPQSKFVRFHIMQGVNLMILDIVYIIINCLISLTVSPNYIFGLSNTYIPLIILLLNSILGIFITVLSIIGVINAVTGKMKPLPVIGKIKLIK